MKEGLFYHVDAFTHEPFRGNPAGVCILDQPLNEKWMQALANEINLSETAFLYPKGRVFRLRWFTPKVEVDLCGHATLASAHVLYEIGQVPKDQEIHFETRSGLLLARFKNGMIEMDFPATYAKAISPPKGLLEALGIFSFSFIGKNQEDYLIVVENPDHVRNCQPEFKRLQQIPCRGVILTSKDDSGKYDFISRFFAPRVGIDEDPVTGSAHCTLGPYWASVLNKSVLFAYQASSRGGEIRVQPLGDRVLLQGEAVTVMECRFRSSL